MPKYNSVSNIPAKIFFDVLETKDFNLLEPIDGETEMESVFTAIYDDYFIKRDNHTSKEYLRLQQELFFMCHKIDSIHQVIDFLTQNKTTKEMRNVLLESLISIGVNINLENDFSEEVTNILQVEVGVLENEVSFMQNDIQAMSSQGNKEAFNFYETLVGLESIHERNLNDDMVLAKLIELEKTALKKIEMKKKNNGKFNT